MKPYLLEIYSKTLLNDPGLPFDIQIKNQKKVPTQAFKCLVTPLENGYKLFFYGDEIENQTQFVEELPEMYRKPEITLNHSNS